MILLNILRMSVKVLIKVNNKLINIYTLNEIIDYIYRVRQIYGNAHFDLVLK